MKKNRDIPINIIKKDTGEESRLFWKKKTPEERLSAVEFLREHYYIICGFKSVPRIRHEMHIVKPFK